MTRVVLALCAFLIAALPSLAHADIAERVCRVDDKRLPKGAALIKTFGEDGTLHFQSSLVLPVMKHGEERLKAFVVWGEGAASDAPKIWIVHDFIDHGIVTGNSQLRMKPVGGRKESEAAIGRQMTRGSFEIFEIDPAELSANFGAATALKLRFVDLGPGKRLPHQYDVTEELNLEQLHVEIAAHLAVARGSAAFPCVAVDDLAVPPVIDARNYDECSIVISDETGYFSVDEYRFWWQGKITPGAYFEAQRTMYSDEGPDAFLANMADPFSGKMGISIEFRLSLVQLSRNFPETFVFTADTVRYEVRVRQGQAVLDRDALWRLDATGALVNLTATDARGKKQLDTKLDARFLSNAKAKLLDMRAKLLVAREDRMKYCAPAQAIIIT